MLLLRLMQFVFIVWSIWFLFSQIIYPSVLGIKLFPIFRKDSKTIEGQHEDIKDSVELLKKKKQIKELLTEAENLQADIQSKEEF